MNNKDDEDNEDREYTGAAAVYIVAAAAFTLCLVLSCLIYLWMKYHA